MDVTFMPSRTALLVRALVNILLGAVILAWPGLTVLVLVIIFAINILLTGLFMVFEPAFDRKNPHAALTVIFGVLLAVAGVYLLGRPQLTLDIVTLLIAFWALLFGMVDLYVGFAASKQVKGTWLLVLTGILAVIFGIYLLFNPTQALLALIWVVGVYALISGTVLGVLALFAYPKVKGKK